ncbi:NUDIX hydrolase domain-like protein, partial [Dimargaris cristalligena]
REAAVLLPLCTIGGQPSVLFTVRSMSLSTHQGEISFPGGMRDPTDPSPEYTSLRETFEEIHIDPDRIAILGGTHAVPNVDGTIRVHPYIGVIDGGAPLDPGTLKYNRAELSKVFGLSVAELLDPDCRTMVP